MNLIIKPMETPAEIEGKGYVHWKAWQEAYTGLIGQSFWEGWSLERCVQRAYGRPGNTLVAKDGEKVIGFVSYGSYRWEDLPGAGEVGAIYILQEYYGQKIGYALMQETLKCLARYDRIALWVLKGNERAIRFYEKCGFRFDGGEKADNLGKPVTELRMVLNR